MAPTKSHQLLLNVNQTKQVQTGWVEAGFLSQGIDSIEVGLNLHEYVVKHEESTFFLRVIGESMQGAGIFPGDILVVDRSLPFRNGTIAVVVYAGNFMVKRVVHEKEKIYLKSESNASKTIVIENFEEILVWGIVTYVVHRVT